MASLIHNRYASTKFDWIINDFAKVNSEEGLCSDVFSLGGFEWQVQIYPKGYGDVFEYLSIYLTPVDWNNYPTAEFSASVLNLYDPNESATEGLKHKFDKVGNYGWGSSTFMPLSDLHDPDEGYIVHGTCIIRVEVSCRIIDDFVTEYDNERNAEKVMQFGDYPGAVQPFGKGQDKSKVTFRDDKQEFEDIGGFHILEKQAPLYKQIWMEYGHIPSTNVMPITSYQALVLVVKDLMSCITDMNKCHYVDLSAEMIERWEDMIIMAEKLEFSIGWLRERFEYVKKGMCGMQNVKTELLEHGKRLRAIKSRIRVLKNVRTKAEVELISEMDDVREKISGLLSESDTETYLKIGDDTLLDGLLDDGVY
ncbi:MATH domain and coiled-coil domain-containing protein At3g58210-like [Papaver somniferum]|uniref:MATH domain and coiled-coil domain-containing protein At3g58210-like n=1 Tax=Papaver somniferum TaxID=3469 RepID=UPI000E6FA3EE|nr:MATH domain and coiled-coil domain-containing protein At3g58210-like [Papaver somniferum]